MGFSYYIEFLAAVNEDTGKPDHAKLEDVCVPEHLRPYLTGDGWVFANYIRPSSCSGAKLITHIDVPDWERDCSWWTEEQHNRFKELVDWLVDLAVKKNIYSIVIYS